MAPPTAGVVSGVKPAQLRVARHLAPVLFGAGAAAGVVSGVEPAQLRVARQVGDRWPAEMGWRAGHRLRAEAG